MSLIQLLQQLFGKKYLSKIMGTRANVAKPIKMDKNSPYRIYSDKAFEDPDLLFKIEKKLEEYGPYVLSNRNTQEVANFELNARRALAAKNKGTTKPEAEVFDLGTKKKVNEAGIMQLKEELGLPKGVPFNSPMGKNLSELKRTTKEVDLKAKDIEDTLDKELGNLLDDHFGVKKSGSASSFNEARRRPIIRQILAEDETFRKNLTTEEYDDLLFGKDLDKGGDPNKDPFAYLNKYFIRDENQLEILDEIIEDLPFSTPAEISAEFKKRTGGLKMKKTKTVEEYAKDGDLDPGGMAEGGRIGFASGTVKGILAMLRKKFGKQAATTANKLEQPDFSKLKAEFEAFQKRNPDVELPYANKDKRLVPEGMNPELVDLAILQGEFARKYKGIIPDELMEKILADTDVQRVKEIIGEIEQAVIMRDKGMSTDKIINTLKQGAKSRKDNASGGLNYLMGM